MATHIDLSRIRHVVQQYFQYVVLSHKWEDNEPLFQEVIQITVYDLGDSPTHDKLQTYCKIARNAGFHWAWSDTVCINQTNVPVLQESLVAIFQWYQGAALMIVFLRGVTSSSPAGALAESVWNKRGWTLQEYIAAKEVHFYRGLDPLPESAIIESQGVLGSNIGDGANNRDFCRGTEGTSSWPIQHPGKTTPCLDPDNNKGRRRRVFFDWHFRSR